MSERERQRETEVFLPIIGDKLKKVSSILYSVHNAIKYFVT